MGDLLWTCKNGGELVSEANGVLIVIARAPMAGGFRYQLLGQIQTTDTHVALASGHRDELCDAMEAAERAVQGYATPCTARYRPDANA